MEEEVQQNVEESIDWFTTMAQSGILYTILAAVLILLITAAVSKLVTRLMRTVLHQDKLELPSGTIFINIARIAVWAVGVSVLLATCFNVNVSALVTALGVGGIALSLGFQDTISNLIGGLQVSIGKVIQPGDRIMVNGDEGIVGDVTWRHTCIKTDDGQVIIIPNSNINKSALMKYPDECVVKIPFTLVDEIEDLKSVGFCIEKDCAKTLEKLSSLAKEPVVNFLDLSKDGIDGEVVLRIMDRSEKNDARIAVIEALQSYSRQQSSDETTKSDCS